jgi:iron complex outermembrane receptor protein
VLKGPQGTLFGGANVGGAIKYVTKDPTATWENQATVEFGTYATRNYQAVLSGPLSDQAGIRASVYYDSHGGNIWDTYNRFMYGAVIDRGARVTFVDAPNSDNKIHVWLSADDFWTSSQNLMYTVNPPITGGNANQYKTSVDDFFIPSFTRHVASAAVQLDHAINSSVTLTSLTSFFTSYNRGYTDFYKKPIPLDLLQQNQDHRVYSEELRLASTGGSNVDWLVGAFFQGHKSEALSIDNNYNGDPNNPQILPGALGYDYDRDNKMQRRYALFGDVTYHVGNWQYELGLRGEYYTSSLTAVNTLNTVDPADPTTAVLPIAPGSLSGHQFAPRVSAQYKFSPTVNVYGTISRGFTPGDLIEEAFTVHPYRPEVATNYEIGMKSLLANSVQLNAAVFYTYYKDRLYLYQRLAAGVIQDLTSNVGPSTNVGAEFDISAPLPGGFKVSAGLGVLRAQWGHTTGFVNPTSPLPPPPAPEPNSALDLNGYNVPFSPSYTASVNLEWRHNFSGHQFGARASGSFIGRSYWDPQNFAYQEAYQIVNLASWLDLGKWRLNASVTNLTQTQYNTVYWPGPDVGPPFDIARINRPRQFMVGGSMRF